ncbi:RING finger protein 222 [Protobothrops mucrosquamatus]|uniref:RING finger protein 222 n=1 Tax=Protobothrops mucrosquamatus TaxID=103944 RepID=UPI0007757E4F|nr:RING finger protein 222 [Protobothrops mucrosquamatus]
MSQNNTSKEAPAATPGECPVCYETFQSPKVSRRMLSCGHTFCHDCLVKCLLSHEEGPLPNTLTCPICRFVTFLCNKRDCLPSKPALNPSSLELPLSPSSLPLTCGVPPSSANTLVVPGHFLLPLHTYDRHQCLQRYPTMDSIVQPIGLERESHIFIITQCGMPLIEEDYVTIAQDHSTGEAPDTEASQTCPGMGCFQSPIMMAVFLISAVALLGAVLPWLLLVRNNE